MDISTAGELLSVDETASRLGLSPGYLANLRSRMEGPGYVKRGKRVSYIKASVERWDRERTIIHHR